MYNNRYTPTRSQNRPVSEGQKNFIRTLLAEREVPQHERDQIFQIAQRGMTSTEAGNFITFLKTLPFKGGVSKAVRDNTPAEVGVYALNNQIFAVREVKDRETGKPFRFARRAEFTTADHTIVTLGAPEAHRVEWVKAPGMQYKLAHEGRRLSLEDIEKLSLEFEQCFVCGKGLKVLESKKQGIGPVCRGKVNGVNATSLPQESELKGMEGYTAKEQYDGEDVAPHGAAYQWARELAEKFWATNPTPPARDDVSRTIRRILEDEEGEYTLAIKESIYDAKHTR